MSQRSTRSQGRQQSQSQCETQPSGSQSQVHSSRASRNKSRPSNKENKVSQSQRVLTSVQFSQSISDDEEHIQGSKLKGISQEELNDAVGTVIRYLLTANQAKNPLQRVNIQKNALNNNKHYRVIMNEVKKTLKKIFGFELIEFDNGKFILYNMIENTLPHLLFTNVERSQQVLLFFILGHIFMSGESCSEDSLWEFLRNLSVLPADNSKHPYFGDVRVVVEEFIKHRYIDKEKIQNNDVEVIEFKWGVRSEYELEPRKILEFMEVIYQNRTMQTWKTQYQAVKHREKCDEYRNGVSN